MKILFYNHTGKVSGAEKVLLMILARLDRDRFAPVLACPGNGPLAEMARKHNIRAINLQALEARFTWNAYKLCRYVASFARVIRRARRLVIDEQPDIVHANSIRAGLVMSAATFGLETPVVWHTHDILPRHPFSYAIRFFAFASARTSILAVSQAVADRFRSRLGRWFRRRIPITVIHNAVELERFQPNSETKSEIRHALGFNDTDQLVGIVGHLTPNKGQVELIEAFAKLSRSAPDAILLVIGEPLFNRGTDYAESLVRAANSLGVADRIQFLGSREDVPAIMQGLDLLVVNSRTEAFPLTVLEGLASGTPVLATAVGGIPEIIRHRENGWLVPARDEKALPDALLKLLSDAKLREQLGQAGRREAVARFSTERFLGEIHSLYRGAHRHGETPHRARAESLKAELTVD